MGEGTGEAAATAAVFKALSDSTRRRILVDLAHGELAAGQLAARFPISGPSVSRHLAVLKAAGLVTERRDANRVLYSLAGPLLAAELAHFLADVFPDQDAPRRHRKKKAKAPAKTRSKGPAPGPPPTAGPTP